MKGQNCNISQSQSHCESSPGLFDGAVLNDSHQVKSTDLGHVSVHLLAAIINMGSAVTDSLLDFGIVFAILATVKCKQPMASETQLSGTQIAAGNCGDVPMGDLSVRNLGYVR